MIRNHGQKQKGENLCLGLNARLDTLQAAILLEKLSIFKQEFKQRQLLAENYKRLFSTEKNVITPFVESFNQSVYAQYTLYVKRRNNLSAHLNKKKIPFMIFYAKPTYKQKAYKDRNLKLKNTEYACKNVISIPFYPGMKINDQYEIVNAIKNFYRSTK